MKTATREAMGGGASELHHPEPAAIDTARRARRGVLRAAGSWALRALTGAVIALFAAIALGPMVLPYKVLTVLSGSMEPTLPVGSMIVLRPAQASALRPGDVITFNHPDLPERLVTHRVARVEVTGGKAFFVTKGDANGTPDAWRIPATGTGWRHAATFPKLGYALRTIQSPRARFFLTTIPALLLGVIVLVRVWRPERPARVPA